MEMMPHHPVVDSVTSPEISAEALPTFGSLRDDWTAGLPALGDGTFTLRELTLEDAPSLLAHLTTDEVARFIAPPPTSVEGFEDFIRWAHLRRSQGRYACFGVVPAGHRHAIGMFQIKLLDPVQGVAEWGFVLGRAYWGTGLFLKSARRVVDFVFAHMGIARLEARSVVQNGRGNGALRKVGAVRVGVVRGSFVRLGVALDQALWMLHRSVYWAASADRGATVH